MPPAYPPDPGQAGATGSPGRRDQHVRDARARYPGGPPAPAIVMRSQLVRPGATFSGWTAPVAATRVVTLPAGWTPEQAGDLPGRAVVEQAYPDAGRQVTLAAKPIWIHCFTGDHSSPSAHASPGCRRTRWPGLLLGVSDPGTVGRRGHAGRAPTARPRSGGPAATPRAAPADAGQPGRAGRPPRSLLAGAGRGHLTEAVLSGAASVNHVVLRFLDR